MHRVSTTLLGSYNSGKITSTTGRCTIRHVNNYVVCASGAPVDFSYYVVTML